MQNIIFSILLFLYPLRHIRLGVEWWDTGYNYGNFMYMDHMDPMWMFSTYLANALGNLFTKLPFGQYMMGLQFYTGLMVSILALMGYYFFTKKMNIPPWIVFAGEMIAISLCWCPTALLYNYLTYVLFAAGVILLFIALTEERKLFFLFAGICLGANVFVRFPNLVQMSLIAAVWGYGIMEKKKIKEVLGETGICILGYLSGIGFCFGYISIRYGASHYVESIIRLFRMSNDAPDYTLYSMVMSQYREYMQSLHWLSYLAMFTGLGVLVFLIFPKKFLWVKRIGFTLGAFGVFYCLMEKNMFNMKYDTKVSVFAWAVLLLVATLVVGMVSYFRKNSSKEERFMGMVIIIIIVITPLGSNNHLFSSINNLFLVAPFTLWMLYRFLKWLPKEKAFSFPVTSMICCILFALGIQSISFGIGYVFQEANGGQNLHTKIGNNDILKGMYTDPERAELISDITEYVNENHLQGQEVILYGWIPSMSYYLQMPFAISPWPDLASYQYSIMEEDLNILAKKIEEGDKEKPVVLIDSSFAEYLQEGVKPDEESKDDKFGLIMNWIETYSYFVSYESDKFIMLESAK